MPCISRTALMELASPSLFSFRLLPGESVDSKVICMFDSALQRIAAQCQIPSDFRPFVRR